LARSTPHPSSELTTQPILIIHMSSSTGLFTNDTRIEGVRSLRAARGRGRHDSILDRVQS